MRSIGFKTEYGSLVKLGLPVLVTQLGIIVVSFADTMMVGHYGIPQLSSAAFVNSLFLIPFVMQIGFASGLTPLVGALFSRRSFFRCGRILKSGLICNIALSLIFMMVMGVLYFLLPFFNQDEDLLPIIRPYYIIILVSLLPSAVFNAFQQTANGSTDTAMPMWVMVVGNILNIIGNWIFIWGRYGFPELGLTGAGISTLITRCLMAITIIFLFLHRNRYRNYITGMKLSAGSKDTYRRIWRTSFPLMVQSGVECLLWSIGAVVCGGFGKIQIAAFQIVNTIGQLGFMIYMSFSTAVAIRVANFTGLGQPSSIRKTTTAGLHLLLMMGTLSSLLFLFMSEQLIGFFTDDPYVIATALTLIPPLIIYQYGDAIQLNYANALRGLADVKPLLFISLISYIIIGLPTLFIFADTLSFKAVGVYYSFVIALFSAAVMLIFAYKKRFRKIFPT